MHHSLSAGERRPRPPHPHPLEPITIRPGRQHKRSPPAFTVLSTQQLLERSSCRGATMRSLRDHWSNFTSLGEEAAARRSEFSVNTDSPQHQQLLLHVATTFSQGGAGCKNRWSKFSFVFLGPEKRWPWRTWSRRRWLWCRTAPCPAAPAHGPWSRPGSGRWTSGAVGRPDPSGCGCCSSWTQECTCIGNLALMFHWLILEVKLAPFLRKPAISHIYMQHVKPKVTHWTLRTPILV